MNKEVIEKFITVIERFTQYMEIQLKVQSALYEELQRKAERIRILEGTRGRGVKVSEEGLQDGRSGQLL